jgi:hypothetical protein
VTWTKLCDNFFADPTLLRVRAEVGHCAALLHVEALVYSNRLGTDGRIDRWCIPAVTPMPPKEVARWAAGLVAAGVWEETETGWRVVSGIGDQPTAEQVEARRAEVSRKRSAAGKAGAKARWADGKMANVVANAKQSYSNQEWQSDGPDPSRPVPTRPGHAEGDTYPPAREARQASPVPAPQSPEDAPSGADGGVIGADVEEALHRATKGALRFSAAPSTQTAAIVGYLRRAGLTREELPHLADVVAHPGELWEWAKVRQGTVAWLAGKADAATREHDCARLQEALAEARRRHGRALIEAAEAARRTAAQADARPPMTDAERAEAIASLKARLSQRSTTP